MQQNAVDSTDGGRRGEKGHAYHGGGRRGRVAVDDRYSGPGHQSEPKVGTVGVRWPVVNRKGREVGEDLVGVGRLEKRWDSVT